uniref:Uncharacterized protein n=1 Tax=Candidatus Kentrum sp. SD TaxID=2126332 RepID=A0A451BN35_9GAMM|nr:MAG: hypothetical protein BECKSD772D_GA0070982_106210 [Candidatus Kentron sp. SD]
MFRYRKNKDSEKTGARARNTPFGTYCYALANQEHSRTRSVRMYILFISRSALQMDLVLTVLY